MAFAARLRAAHGRPCPYCEMPMQVRSRKHGVAPSRDPAFPTRDHVVPRSQASGLGTVIVCYRCNQDKRDLTLPAWLSVLTAQEDPRAVIVRAYMLRNPNERARMWSDFHGPAYAR